jgi:hypothetical protein
MTHEYRELPDRVYAHLVNPQCTCGWRFSTYVTQKKARSYFDRHARRANTQPAEEDKR